MFQDSPSTEETDTVVVPVSTPSTGSDNSNNNANGDNVSNQQYQLFCFKLGVKLIKLLIIFGCISIQCSVYECLKKSVVCCYSSRLKSLMFFTH